MRKEYITSVGWLNNHDGSIALVICLHGGHVFVTISKQEFEQSGGKEGLNDNRQLAVDFYNKYGAGR